MIFLLKKKNKIYLLTKNLKTKKLNKKLNYIKIDLFLVKEIKELKIYELNLFKELKFFNIQYIVVEIIRSQHIYTKNILFWIKKQKVIYDKKNSEKKKSTIFY